jgi:hypothetical protein
MYSIVATLQKALTVVFISKYLELTLMMLVSRTNRQYSGV